LSYLVDANVLSEPTRAAPSDRVVDWLRNNEADLNVDPVILGEVRYGILLLGKSKKRERLERWFDEGVRKLNCLAWDAPTGLRWAELLARLKSSGKTMPIKDSLIAATALEHELTIVTRDVEDFAKAGVQLLNPFEED
jgi:hypothetical protein